MRVAMRTNFTVTILLTLVGLTCLLVLPGLPVGRASITLRAAAQKATGSGLDASRQASMERLYLQLKGGDPFSEEEEIILRRFGAGGAVADLEADLVISRALYDHYVAAKDLSKEQEELLARYSQDVAHRSAGVADLKMQMLNRRIAAAAAAAPRTTPLVAPANDTCAGAEVIPGAGPFPYLTAVTADITDATVTGDPPLPSCPVPQTVSRSIWYTITPNVTTTYTFTTCPEAPTGTTVEDTVMAIYTSTAGCGGTFSELPTGGLFDGCDDDTCTNFQSTIVTQLNSGVTYYILVWQFGSAAPLPGKTAVQLRVLRALAPANDACAGAIPLTVNTPVNGSTEFSGNDYQLSGSACFTGLGQTSSTATGRDVVYSFTAPSTSAFSFRVTKYSNLGNLVMYATTSCPAATPGTPVTITCNNISGPAFAGSNRLAASAAEELMCLSLNSGQQVFIFVDDNIDPNVFLGSPFTIEANRCTLETEANNTPGTANAVVFGGEGSINATNDVDFYALGSLPVGSRVFALVDAASSNSTDMDLRVTTTVDTLEYDDKNADGAFGGFSSAIGGTPIPAGAGQVFLRANHFSGTACEPYRLYSVVQPPGANPLPGCPAQTTSATAENEPNDSTATANSAANAYFSGSLAGPAPSADVDVFSFTARAGQLVFLALDGDPCRDATPINGQLALLDSAGATLISVDDGGFTSSTTSGAGSLTAGTPNSPAEALVYRITTPGTYYAKVSISPSATGATGAGDYLLSIAKSQSSPGSDTLGVYDPGSRTFYLRNANNLGFADIVVQYGPPGGIPVVGDWDGDGTTSIGVYDPPTRTFYLRNSNSIGFADIAIQYGPPGAIPIVGDWNGDGITTIGVYDPVTRFFYLRNSNTPGFADIVIQYGPPGATPLAGDWNGDGVTTIGVYDPGSQTFYLRNSNTPGFADLTIQYGPNGAIPVVGDWDSNGTVTIGVYDPPSRTFYLRNSNSLGFADITVQYGPPGAIPLAGDWDGL